MIDFTTLPSSQAYPLNNPTMLLDSEDVTFTEMIDSIIIYKDLSARLKKLETSQIENMKELMDIKKATNHFRLTLIHQKSILLRVSWLEQLYEMKRASLLVESRKEAEHILAKLSSLSESPMNNVVAGKLNSLMQALPYEEVEEVQPTSQRSLMEKAMIEIGDAFVNLGKVGRNYVVANVLEKYGDDVTIEQLREHTMNIEQQLEALVKVNEPSEMRQCLDKLPIASYPLLSEARKAIIIDKLVEEKDWNCLEDLENKIYSLDQYLTRIEQKQESKSATKASHRNAMTTVNIKKVKNENKILLLDVKATVRI